MDKFNVSLAYTLVGHQNPIYCLANAAQDHILYSAGNDKGIVEWDLTTGTFRRILCAVSSSVYAMKQLPQEALLAVGLREGNLLIVDTAEQKLVAKLPMDKSPIFGIEVLADKQELVAITENGCAYVWSLSNYTLLYQFTVSKTALRSLAISPDQQQLAIGAKDGTVTLYDCASFQLIRSLQVHEGMVTSLSYSLDGSQLRSGSKDAHIHIINTKDFSLAKSFVPHMFTVYGLVPLLGLPAYATASRDKTLKIWDETTDALLNNIGVDRGYDAHRLSVNALIWNPQLQLLISAGDDKLIKVWSIK